jgi:molybdopterin converting factor small subunit
MNLMEATQKEIERNIEARQAFEEIGPAGAWALSNINAAIKEAQRCINEGDTVAMIAAYEELKKTEL